MTFTERHPQPPAQDLGLRRPAGKPPPRKRKLGHSAVQLVLQDRSARRAWGCTDGEAPAHSWSLGLIHLGSKEDSVSRFRMPSFGSWNPKESVGCCHRLLEVSTEVNFMVLLLLLFLFQFFCYRVSLALAGLPGAGCVDQTSHEIMGICLPLTLEC